MKRFFTELILAFTLFILIPTQISANCDLINNPIDCTQQTGCLWQNDDCIPQSTNPNPVPNIYSGQFSQYAQQYQTIIGTQPFNLTVGDLISSLLPYILSGAGLVLFAMLIAGGFSMLTAVSDPKKAEAGKQRITAAVIGFIIIFVAYWLTQILEIVLGVSIL